MHNNKFLGVCILLAAVIISAVLIWHGKTTSQTGRYQFQVHSNGVTWVIDTTTGELKSRL